jgi:hypothetical protein
VERAPKEQMLVKQLKQPQEVQAMNATWKPHEKHGDLTERSDLPDSVFAFPKERKEPLTDATHVRNAIARFDQVTDVSDEKRALAFANIKKAADYYDVDVSESDCHELGSRSRTGRTAEDRRESARAGAETKRERGELSEEARKGVDTKRESGDLTEEARKAVETKRERGTL